MIHRKGRCPFFAFFAVRFSVFLSVLVIGCDGSSTPTAPDVPSTDDSGNIELNCATQRRFTEVAHSSTCDRRSDGTFLCDLEILLENNCERAFQHVSAKWSLTRRGSETRLFRTEGICWAGESPGVAHVEYTQLTVAPGSQRRVDGCIAFENLAAGNYDIYRNWQGCTVLTSRGSCFGFNTAPAPGDPVLTFEIPVEIPELDRW